MIVDDSRSARVVLKRMLETHALDVDTAESAEAALEYLNSHRPDVIFMDHLMPGMDGFEAVSAIKNNPATATIPIMMYTSQEGEVYVGQARALGALGVLPKTVAPVEVSKVLRNLPLIGEAAGGDAAGGERAEPRNAEDAGEDVDRNLRELIQDLFDQQRAVMRRDLLDSYEAIAARVADELRAPRAAPAEEASPRPLRAPARYRALVAVLAAALLGAGWLYWQRDQALQALRQQNEMLTAALEQQRSIEADGVREIERQLSSYEQSLDSAFVTALGAVEWALNRSASYGFDEIPLGDERLELVEGLADRLLELGFSGEVVVETHVGDFCMTVVDGGYHLAPAEIDLADCTRVGYEYPEAVDLGLRQSVAFANFVRIAEARTNGRIRYSVISRGNAEPLVPYPAPSAVTAGDWNAVARVNNRVEIALLPDG